VKNTFHQSGTFIFLGLYASSCIYSLRYGSGSTEGQALEKEIDEICPNEYMYDVCIDRVVLSTAYEPVEENTDWDLIFLPERFLPDKSGIIESIKIFDVDTRRYGKLAVIRSKSGR
jgi:hypothetical protein